MTIIKNTLFHEFHISRQFSGVKGLTKETKQLHSEDLYKEEEKI